MPDATTPTQDLISKEMGAEIVVMDASAQQVHLLKDDAADVWREGLRQEPGMSRRNLLRSATVLAGAGITTMALPPAIAMASSGVGTTVTLVTSAAQVRGTQYAATGTVTRAVGSVGAGQGVPGVTVTLFAQRLNNGGNDTGAAVNLGNAVSQSNGAYAINFTPALAMTAGNYRYYTVVTANSTFNGSTSSNVPVVLA